MVLSRRDLVASPLALAGASMLGLAGTATAQASAPTPNRGTINLWPSPPTGRTAPPLPEVIEQTSQDPAYSSRRLKGIMNPRLMVFPAANPNGAAMLIIPGGGFGWNYFEHEGAYVAEALNQAGITGFVLFYRLAQEGWPDPAAVGPADAQRAMRVIRAQSQRFHLDPVRVGVMGFSAGGFLAATLATRHETPFYAPHDATDTLSARPLVAAPIYPVQSVDPAYAYVGVAPSLFGGTTTPADIQTWSPDLNVTATAAATFLAHAEDDGLVPVTNTTRLRDAMRAQQIPVETHLFANGGHGFGIPGDPGARKLWIPLFLNFARHQKLIT